MFFPCSSSKQEEEEEGSAGCCCLFTCCCSRTSKHRIEDEALATLRARQSTSKKKLLSLSHPGKIQPLDIESNPPMTTTGPPLTKKERCRKWLLACCSRARLRRCACCLVPWIVRLIRLGIVLFVVAFVVIRFCMVLLETSRVGKKVAK